MYNYAGAAGGWCTDSGVAPEAKAILAISYFV